jgi:hypothetical protein
MTPDLLLDQLRMTVSDDDTESFTTDTVLLTVQVRLPRERVHPDLDEALTELGQRIMAAARKP